MGCRLRCFKDNVVWRNCKGNKPNCNVYTHPTNTVVRKLEFKTLNARIDLRNMPSCIGVRVKVFTGPKDFNICDYIISKSAVKVNDINCVRSVLFSLTSVVGGSNFFLSGPLRLTYHPVKSGRASEILNAHPIHIYIYSS